MDRAKLMVRCYQGQTISRETMFNMPPGRVRHCAHEVEGKNQRS